MRSINPLAGAAIAVFVGTSSATAFADDFDDILNNRGPLFRKQIELSNTLAKLGGPELREAIDAFHAEYGSLQKYQQMEAQLSAIVPRLPNKPLEFNTEADRSASRLPTVAPAPEQFLARQTTRIVTDAIDIRLVGEIAAVSPLIDLDKARASVSQARQLYAAREAFDPSLLVAGVPRDLQQQALDAATRGLAAWNTANDQLQQGTKTLQTRAADMAGRLQAALDSINVEVARGNNTINELQNRLLHATLPPKDQLDDYGKLFDAVFGNSERMRILNNAVFGRVDQVIAVTDATRQIVGLPDTVGALNADRKSLVDGMTDITKRIGAVANTLTFAGLPDPVVNLVGQGVKYAQAAESLVSNIATGNYIGAILGVTGIFGGGGPSQAEIFHQQIMAGIDPILKNQQIMIQGINKLLEGQQQIISQLARIETEMENNQRETLARFDQLNSKLFQIQITLVELQSTDLDQCAQLQSLGTSDWGIIAEELNDDNQRRRAYGSCVHGIDELINTPLVPPTGPTTNFARSYYRFDANPEVVGVSNAQQAEQYGKQLDDLFNYFQAAYPDDSSRRRALLQLWEASPDASVPSGPPRADFDPATSDFHNAFFTKINYNAVKTAVGYALAAHQFMDMGQNGTFLSSLPKGATFGSTKNYDIKDQFGFAVATNLAALQKLDKLVDLARAQQMLLAGGSLFDKIADGLSKGDITTISLLTNYPTIAQNYIHWRLRRDASGPFPVSNAGYEFAYQASPDEAYMQSFAPGLRVHWNDRTAAQQCASDGKVFPIPKGWSAALAPCLYVSLPTVQDFQKNLMRPTSGLYDMNNAKEQLQDAMAQYRFTQTKLGRQLVDDEIFKYAIKRPTM